MKKSQVSQYKTWVEIDSRAILHNFGVAEKRVGKDVTVMCVVKSNAYGHGLREVAKILKKSANFSKRGWFGVDSIDEALMLKKAGTKNTILILGYIPKQRLAEAIKNAFRFALYDIQTLKESARLAHALRKKVYVHLKLETGTYRQGIMFNELPMFVRLLEKYPQVVVEGLYTHFADTEDVSSVYYKEQLENFERSVEVLKESGYKEPKYKHTAASAAVLIYPNTHFNMVRFGISLYGLYPSKNVRNRVSNIFRLKPALSWKTRIVQVKDVPKNATIGYDRTFRARRSMKIAVLPIGYWDGYDRKLSNTGSVFIKGTRASVVGNICMNLTMVDVTRVSGVAVHDEVLLLGKQGNFEITAEEVAKHIGTINYEVVTRVNPLIPRVVV